MIIKKINIILITMFLFGLFPFVHMNAQSRSVINEGVDNYEEGKFDEAEKNFKTSIDDKFETYEGHFNLGDALY
ncbi:MAG: hypothetical protein KAI45_00815, partial [Melioribacteraceae bacterium]|nr:hypothetical protein [Melioribacteraceae bacterium]